LLAFDVAHNRNTVHEAANALPKMLRPGVYELIPRPLGIICVAGAQLKEGLDSLELRDDGKRRHFDGGRAASDD